MVESTGTMTWASAVGRADSEAVGFEDEAGSSGTKGSEMETSSTPALLVLARRDRLFATFFVVVFLEVFFALTPWPDERLAAEALSLAFAAKACFRASLQFSTKD